ncbi:MAG: hypothetical protein DRO11_01375 [Methanobacteriota archaeon]|nr:MAG: hypothetical protein DRO11_01375 [Euryarchaeota archaeon]
MLGFGVCAAIAVVALLVGGKGWWRDWCDRENGKRGWDQENCSLSAWITERDLYGISQRYYCC